MYDLGLLCLHLIDGDNLCDALRVPEQLVDVVVADYMLMIPFATDEFSFDDFISLISHESK